MGRFLLVFWSVCICSCAILHGRILAAFHKTSSALPVAPGHPPSPPCSSAVQPCNHATTPGQGLHRPGWVKCQDGTAQYDDDDDDDDENK